MNYGKRNHDCNEGWILAEFDEYVKESRRLYQRSRCSKGTSKVHHTIGEFGALLSNIYRWTQLNLI
jgi:hypothetical protein